MNRGIYVAVSAMMSGTKKLTDIANNVANVNTVGYKKDLSIIKEFSDLVMTKLDENVGIGNMHNQVYIDDTYTLYQSGMLVTTDVLTDVCINGEGFFKVQLGDEYVYTRNGAFRQDVEGYLVTADGGYVLDKNNERINYRQNPEAINNVMVVDFENKMTLVKYKNSYFRNEFNLSQEVQVPSTIKKGMLESSNIDIAEELTDMIKSQRYFQFNQKALMTNDELLEKITEF